MSEFRETRCLLVLLCFLLSGFAARLDPTAWPRELGFVFGTSDLAVAAVLAACSAQGHVADLMRPPPSPRSTAREAMAFAQHRPEDDTLPVRRPLARRAR